MVFERFVDLVGGWRLRYVGLCAGRIPGDSVDQFQHQQVLAKELVTDQFDVAVDLADGMGVILGEVAGDAQQPGSAPLDLVGVCLPEPLHDQPGEFRLVVQQPVQVEQALVDDVLVDVPLVLDDDRAAVLVQAQGVDDAAMGLAGAVFGGQEPDPEKDLHLAFHQGLQGLLHCGRLACQFHRLAVLVLEEFDVTHAASRGTRPRTSILPVTAAEIRAARRSLRRVMALSPSLISLDVSCTTSSTFATITRCSSMEGRGMGISRMTD